MSNFDATETKTPDVIQNCVTCALFKPGSKIDEFGLRLNKSTAPP